MSATIAIVGSAGFLGHRLAMRLARAGYRVYSIARSASQGLLPSGVHHLQATMDDMQAMAPVLARADYLLHLAWDTTPGTSQLQPVLEATNNLLPTLRLLEQLQNYPDCRLLFISSGGAIYSERSAAPWPEHAELAPRSYYGAAKLAIEHMLGAYHAQTGNNFIIIRPSNIFGPGQESRRMFGVIPTLMHCLLHNKQFDIWGDGNDLRDYLFIDDFEEFILRLLTSTADFSSYEIFNAGSGHGVSLNELCSHLEAVSGKQLARCHVSRRSVDKNDVILDSDKARHMLGWHATTSLRQGLDTTWKWFLKQQ